MLANCVHAHGSRTEDIMSAIKNSDRRVSISCVRAWRFARKIPVVQLNGKNVLFRRTDVDEFIERNSVPAMQP
jgi:hypothetical protein